MKYRVYGYDVSTDVWVSLFGTDIDSLISQLRERGCTQIGVQVIYGTVVRLG